MRVLGYARVSTTEQVNGTSLQEQRKKIKAVAELISANKGEVVELLMFVDEGVSGAKPLDKRPEGAKLLEALEPGDTVVVSKLDRAFRSASDALDKADWFSDSGVDLILADMGTDPVTKSGVGRMFFTILAALAEFERERIKERVLEGRAAKKNAGGYIGGRPPFGFKVNGRGKDAELIPDPQEQEALEVLLAQVDAAKNQGAKIPSFRTLAACVYDWTGVKISHTAVGRILKSLDLA
jgi:DNA invertase Pin-like site-specific DNA recombinase